ncbi:MAG: hypothetical protein HY015_03140 [Bacteroidetes bacterium]|nr:hypothetical protein [Bacteroidota bacterium]
MNSDRVKFYTELMKSLTAFILGTGAGVYALITTNGNENLLIFVTVLCIFSIGLFASLFVYLDKNI